MYRLLIIAVLTAFLAGCAGTVSKEELARINRAGVVSMLGSTFHGISIGTTVFNNEYFSSEVPEWQVDDITVENALSMLRASNRFKSAAFDRSRVNLAGFKFRAEEKALWDEVRRQGFDTLIVLEPQRSDNAPFFRPGYGLFERSIFRQGSRCVYAAYVVRVYEVPSGSLIGAKWGGGDSEPCQIGSDNDFPFRTSFDAYTEEEIRALRERVLARISYTLHVSLKELALLERE
jgi:hypothetical protein